MGYWTVEIGRDNSLSRIQVVTWELLIKKIVIKREFLNISNMRMIESEKSHL